VHRERRRDHRALRLDGRRLHPGGERGVRALAARLAQAGTVTASDCPKRMARTDFPQEWQDWVAHNVQRGCSSVDIFNTLVREGFAPEVAERALKIGRASCRERGEV